MDILAQLAGYQNYMGYYYIETDKLAISEGYNNFKDFVFYKFYISNDISKNELLKACNDLAIYAGYESINDFKIQKNNELAQKAGYDSFDMYFKYRNIKACS